MALAQAHFERFHDTIKLSYESNPDLRKKRDKLINELKKSLSNVTPTWSWFNQGSYNLNTGVMPCNRNFDIDIGLSFQCSPSKFVDPVDLKIIVRDALSKKNRIVTIRNSCVTVAYMRNGIIEYHVDLTIYSNVYQQMYLAKGREDSKQDYRVWVLYKPKKLLDYVKGAHKHQNGAQFNRIVRYLKRWRDENLIHNNLSGIALAIAVAEWMEPNFNREGNNPRDIYTLRDLIQTLLDKWIDSRLIIHSPATPYNDLMTKLTDTQMADLKDKLLILGASLQNAIDEPDIYETCILLRRQFGKDFPVPEKSRIPSPSKDTSAIFRKI